MRRAHDVNHEALFLPRHVDVKQDADDARSQLAKLALRYSSAHSEPIPSEVDSAIAYDTVLASVARSARDAAWPGVLQRLEPFFPHASPARFRQAFLAVPRERFVLPEDIARAADDVPLALDRTGFATVSAPHAYFLTYGLLPLEPGDYLIELGTGTGYGAALGEAIVAAQIGSPSATGPVATEPVVAPESQGGVVVSIEIDRVLHDRARRVLAQQGAGRAARITLLWGDARLLVSEAIQHAICVAGDSARIRIAVTYALAEPLEWLLSALPLGAAVVLPFAGREKQDCTEHNQQLVRFVRKREGLVRSCHGVVRYVVERSFLADLR